MVHDRMDDKEADRQRDWDHEAKTLDVDLGNMYLLWICSDQKYHGISVRISLITQNLTKYLSGIRSAIFFIT